MYKYILFLLSLTVSTAYAQSIDVKEGLWEITSKVTFSGMPIQTPALTEQKCITQNSLDPKELLESQNCQYSNTGSTPNSISWSMSCVQQGMKMEGTGKMTYQKTSFNGVFDLEMSGGAGPVKMSTSIDGRYLRACNK